MDNFDLKKYLVENEITSNAKNVKEGWEEEEEAYFADEPKYLRDEKGLWKEYDKTSNLEKGTLVKFYTLTYDRRQKENDGVVSRVEGGNVYVMDFVGNMYKMDKKYIGFILPI